MTCPRAGAMAYRRRWARKQTKGVEALIRAQDAIAAARALIGTPYATLDCIGLIVRVIRTCPGGDPSYRCQGTNWLWRSVGN